LNFALSYWLILSLQDYFETGHLIENLYRTTSCIRRLLNRTTSPLAISSAEIISQQIH